jgi:hypothetical protein
MKHRHPPDPVSIGLAITSIVATAVSTGVSIHQQGKVADAQEDAAKRKIQAAEVAVQQNTAEATRRARKLVALQQASAGGEIFGATVGARQSQTVRDIRTNLRRTNFGVRSGLGDAVAQHQASARTARTAQIAAGISGASSLISQGAAFNQARNQGFGQNQGFGVGTPSGNAIFRNPVGP